MIRLVEFGFIVMKCSALFTVMALSLVTTMFVKHVVAAEQLNEGKRLFQGCAVCHGDVGQGNDLLQTPAIAGLRFEYLQRQLTHYKANKRGAKADDPLGAQMQASSNILDTEQDMDAVAHYIANLPITSLTGNIAGNVKRGQSLYNGNCGACHGSKGEGNRALMAPRLAYQSFDYLARQLKAFKAGKRGYSSDDKYGRQMAMMADSINIDKDLADIVSYLQTLKKAN